MRFADIPKFTKECSYQTYMSFRYFPKWIEECISEMDLQMIPDFQRGHVWTEDQQIAYIEFILRGGKSGRDLYFNCPGWHYGKPGEFVCVDGLQRATAILKFMNNKIPAFGTYYEDFEDKLSYNVGIVVHVNDLTSKKEVLQWYVEMNEGGTPHTVEEIQRVKNMIHDY